MRRLIKTATVWVLIIVAMFAISAGSLAAGGDEAAFTVSMEPSACAVDYGALFTVTIRVDSETEAEYSAMQATISYENEKVEYLSHTFSMSAQPDRFSTVTDNDGLIITSLGGEFGAGELLTITFRAKSGIPVCDAVFSLSDVQAGDLELVYDDGFEQIYEVPDANIGADITITIGVMVVTDVLLGSGGSDTVEITFSGPYSADWLVAIAAYGENEKMQACTIHPTQQNPDNLTTLTCRLTGAGTAYKICVFVMDQESYAPITEQYEHMHG